MQKHTQKNTKKKNEKKNETKKKGNNNLNSVLQIIHNRFKGWYFAGCKVLHSSAIANIIAMPPPFIIRITDSSFRPVIWRTMCSVIPMTSTAVWICFFLLFFFLLFLYRKPAIVFFLCFSFLFITVTTPFLFLVTPLLPMFTLQVWHCERST